MKTIYSYKTGFILLAMMFAFAACKKDGPFKIVASSNSILINGSINNLTIPGGIANGAGAVPPFSVVISGNDAASVTITNRYTLQGSTAIVEKTLGTYPVTSQQASIPAISISALRNSLDPAITATANSGTNTFLIDATMNSGATERRIAALTLANTVVVIDNDIYKVDILSSTTAGVPSFTVVVNSLSLSVKITSRYVVPGKSVTTDYAAGAVVYPTTAVDAVTRSVTIPALTIAKMRDPADPAITGLADVGQQFIVIQAFALVAGTGTAQSSKTANITW